MVGLAAPGRRVLLAAVALALVAACAKQIPREDWGAIGQDATIRATTVDGARYDLVDVTVFTDVLVGVEVGTTDSVRLPLQDLDFLESPGRAALPVLVGVAAAVATVAIVMATRKSDVRPEPTPVGSCPFIYSFDGTQYTLDSETFAGAITRGVQRTDLDNLEHLRAVDGEYRLLLTNERPETQYTDAVTLVAVDHPRGSSVYPDATGASHVYAAGTSPIGVERLRGGSALDDVLESDGRYWVGDPIETADLDVPSELRDGMVLTFPRPESDRGLLAVRGRNTGVAPFALQTLLELQGDDLVSWYRDVDRNVESQSKLRAWVMREGTVHVSVWMDGAWQLQDMLLDVGPHLPKTQVARLDLSGVDADEVLVRLETARGLWALDWVELGVELDVEPALTRLAPAAATAADGRDLRSTLSDVDDVYYTALEGDRVELVFEAPPTAAGDWDRTMMVESTGYYHLHTDHAGPARPALVDRILTEPLFGNRYMLGLLRALPADGLVPYRSSDTGLPLR